MRDHPITPVTEPMQYRAIGLVRAIYCPEDPKHLTRGILRDENGLEIEAVVLGRVLTLMKRHLKMDKPHLWVVYPRCRNVKKLHLQIAGVWEPSTLNILNKQSFKTNQYTDQDIDLMDQIREGDDYFSVRGEVIYTKPDTNELIVKIRQQPRKSINKPTPFKIRLNGSIPLDKLHYFISFDTRRIGNELKIENHEIINPVPNYTSNKGTKYKKSNAKSKKT